MKNSVLLPENKFNLELKYFFIYIVLKLRKLTAILFLIVFLYNVAGYKGFFFYLSQSADQRLDEKIRDDSVPDKDLITVKFPFHVPYIAESKEFESMGGEVNVKGTIYRYVKRKIVRDTLILLCIENKEKSLIEKKRAEYFNKVNDLASNTSKKSDVKQVKTDYYVKINDISPKRLNGTDCNSTYSFVLNSLNKGHFNLYAPPPDLLLS